MKRIAFLSILGAHRICDRARKVRLMDHGGCGGSSVVESRGRAEAMTQKEIHVGIVGANEKSWAKLSHVPAINAFPD
jgi:hypothetical protein